MVDLYGAICRLVGGTGKEPYEATPTADFQAIWKIYLPQVTGRVWTERQFKELLESQGQEFWRGLKKYPWADELWELCSQYAPVMVMSSPWIVPDAAAGKMRWVMENLPPTALERISLTSSKHHLAHPGALLIDDRADACAKFRNPNPMNPKVKGGQAFCWPQPWSVMDWKERDPIAELSKFLQTE